MKAYLIDPFQKKIHDLDIAKALRAWYAVLRCESVDAVCIAHLGDGRCIDVWVDDYFLDRAEEWPCFKIGEAQVFGYGLVLESDRNGESQGVSFSKSYFNGKLFFESWEKRLDAEKFLEELTRVPSWEHV
jgi:hypothetical protein